MQLSTSWEAASRSDTQEILNVLCEPKGCSQEPSTGPHYEPD
jgi:hypothetical protein